MKIKKIAIYGSGDFGQEVFLLINSINNTSSDTFFEFIGFFDDTKKKARYVDLEM
jgi:hypothetical protein